MQTALTLLTGAAFGAGAMLLIIYMGWNLANRKCNYWDDGGEGDGDE